MEKAIPQVEQKLESLALPDDTFEIEINLKDLTIKKSEIVSVPRICRRYHSSAFRRDDRKHSISTTKIL